MDLSQSGWIGLVGFALTSGVAVLLLGGPRWWNGESYEQLEPLIKLKNFWVFLAALLVVGGCAGISIFFVLQDQMRQGF